MIYNNQHNSLKCNYKNADWKGFAMACDNKFSYDNIQETNSTLTKELINIAGDYIPVKKFNNKKKIKSDGIKIVQNLSDKGTRLETGSVILVRGRISKIIKKKKNCV